MKSPFVFVSLLSVTLTLMAPSAFAKLNPSDPVDQIPDGATLVITRDMVLEPKATDIPLSDSDAYPGIFCSVSLRGFEGTDIPSHIVNARQIVRKGTEFVMSKTGYTAVPGAAIIVAHLQRGSEKYALTCSLFGREPGFSMGNLAAVIDGYAQIWDDKVPTQEFGSGRDVRVSGNQAKRLPNDSVQMLQMEDSQASAAAGR